MNEGEELIQSLKKQKNPFKIIRGEVCVRIKDEVESTIPTVKIVWREDTETHYTQHEFFEDTGESISCGLLAPEDLEGQQILSEYKGEDFMAEHHFESDGENVPIVVGHL